MNQSEFFLRQVCFFPIFFVRVILTGVLLDSIGFDILFAIFRRPTVGTEFVYDTVLFGKLVERNPGTEGR